MVLGMEVRLCACQASMWLMSYSANPSLIQLNMVRDREGSILLQRSESLVTSGLVRKIRGQKDKTAC